MKKLAVLLAVTAAILSVATASAHKPSYSDGQFSQKENAWFIQDIDISIVLYHQVTCEAPEIWMSFETEDPGEIFFQLGVPVIERLSDYRPSIALLAPGLPKPDEALPFDVPSHLGAHIFHTEDLDQPQDFFEPFTQTSSWILFEETVDLPEAGRGYLVAFHPLRETGKLWVAVGETEQFGAEDWASATDWFVATQTFHETADFPPTVEPVEEICPSPVTEPEPEPEAGPETGEEVTEDPRAMNPTDPTSESLGAEATEDLLDESESVESGCSTGSGGPLSLLWGLVALTVVMARRDREVA